MWESEPVIFLPTNINDFCFLSNLEVILSYLHNGDNSYLTGCSITDSILGSLGMRGSNYTPFFLITPSLLCQLLSPAWLLPLSSQSWFSLPFSSVLQFQYFLLAEFFTSVSVLAKLRANWLFAFLHPDNLQGSYDRKSLKSRENK